MPLIRHSHSTLSRRLRRTTFVVIAGRTFRASALPLVAGPPQYAVLSRSCRGREAPWVSHGRLVSRRCRGWSRSSRSGPSEEQRRLGRKAPSFAIFRLVFIGAPRLGSPHSPYALALSTIARGCRKVARGSPGGLLRFRDEGAGSRHHPTRSAPSLVDRVLASGFARTRTPSGSYRQAFVR